MQKMQQIQNQQSRRLQQTVSVIAELNIQVVELKKRLEDIDAKNRELSVNMNRQKITNEPVAAVTGSIDTCNNDDALKPRSAIKGIRKRRLNDANDDQTSDTFNCPPNTNVNQDLSNSKKTKV